MFTYLLLGFLVIVCICLVFWYNGDSSKRQRAAEHLRNSVGTFDTSAALALNELNNINEPTSQDRFDRANIIRYNIAENRPNLELTNQIANDYLIALTMLADEQQNNTFIIDTVNDFNIGLDLGTDLGLVKTTKEKTVADNVRIARETSSTRAAAIETALDAATVYTDNRQNVHDSKVNSDLRKVLRQIKSNNFSVFSAFNSKSGEQCKEEATKYINECVSNSSINSATAARALQVLGQIGADHISTYDDTEIGIFAATWMRCDHHLNKHNSNLLRDAVVSALADSMENGTKVCINGRTARMLNSLVTLDYDPIVSSGAMTYEAHRNQIFQETKDIIEKVISDVRVNPNLDHDLKAVANSYDLATDDGNLNPIAEEKFNNLLRTAINNNIANYSEVFTPDELKKIEDECHVYAAI